MKTPVIEVESLNVKILIKIISVNKNTVVLEAGGKEYTMYAKDTLTLRWEEPKE